MDKNNVKVSVDGEVLFDYTNHGSSDCPLYYVSQRDNTTGDVILKVVNTADSYYNTKTKALEGQMSVKIADDGSALLKFTHASDYVISITDQAAIDNKKAAPKSGDDNEAATYVCLLGLAMVAITAATYRKKRACK